MFIISNPNNPDFKAQNETLDPLLEAPKSHRKKIVLLVLGVVVSVALLAFLVKDLDIVKFKQEFSKFNPWYILPLTILQALAMVLRALRSKYLFPREYRKDGSFFSLLEAVLVGFTANSFLPLRAGEIIRPIYLQKRIGLPFASGLASIFTERIFDLLSLLTIASVLLSRIPEPPQFLLTTSAALRVISLIGLTGVVLCAYFGEFTMKLADRIVALILPKKIGDFLLKLLAQVIETLGAVKSFRELFLILVYSFSIWAVTGFYFQLSGAMLGVDLTFFSGLLIAVTVAFAVAAPSSPGFIGTFQFGCALTLTNILHLSQEFSLAYGLLVHATQTVTLVLITILALSFSGQGIKGLLGKN